MNKPYYRFADPKNAQVPDKCLEGKLPKGKRPAAILLLALLLNGCSYRVEKESPALNLRGSGLGFAGVQSQILGPRCARCHAGDVVANYEAVVQNLAEIGRRVRLPAGTRGAMPPGGPLSTAELNALDAWIAAGAPREAAPGGQPGDSSGNNPGNTPVTPPPAPAPLPGSFAEVQTKVFQPKCARCHSGMMSSYERVVANLEDIDEVIAKGEMPPARATQLTEEERQLVLRWIAAGAKREAEEN